MEKDKCKLLILDSVLYSICFTIKKEIDYYNSGMLLLGILLSPFILYFIIFHNQEFLNYFILFKNGFISGFISSFGNKNIH